MAVLERQDIDCNVETNPAPVAWCIATLKSATSSADFGAVLMLDGGQVGARSRLTGIVGYNTGNGWEHLFDVGASGAEIESFSASEPVVMIRGSGPPLDDIEEHRVRTLIGKCPPTLQRVVGMVGTRSVAECYIGGREYFILLYFGNEEPTLRFD